MQFKVPQFIEREAKIIGPLTFRQFLFIGAGGFLIFILYTALTQIHPFLLFFLAIIIGIISLSFAFLKIEGHPLISVFMGFANFITAPRLYLWERKHFMPKIQKKEVSKEESDEEAKDIKVFGKSRLKDLSNQIEIKNN